MNDNNSLTLEAIENALRPLHEAIASANDRQLNVSGIGLHNCVAGAKVFSSAYARAIQLRIDGRNDGVKDIIQDDVLAAYQEGLAEYRDHVRRYVTKIQELARLRPDVLHACQDADRHLVALTAVRDISSLTRRKDNRGGPGWNS